MAKRIALITAVIALCFFLVAGSIWYYLGRKGSSDLENWIGRQLLVVLHHYINPEVQFANLDYRAPRTVVVQDLTITAQDRKILHVARAKLELAEIPRYGRPLRIQEIQLDDPQFAFITSAHGGFVGWSHFVRSKPHRQSIPAGQRLSDVLVLENLAVSNGEIVYESGPSPKDRMTLPGINLKLSTPGVAAERGGWHNLACHLEREPLFDARINGRINLDDGLLEIAKLQLAASLSEKQYTTLPPALQSFLREHEVSGALTASGQGRIPLSDPAQSSGTLQAELRDAHVSYHDAVLPVKLIQVDAKMPEGGIDVRVNGLDLRAAHQPLASVKNINVRLAGIPSAGEPLHIERVAIDQPHVILAAGPTRHLQGWKHVAEIASQQQRHPTSQNVSSLLQKVRLDEFDITDGQLTYRSSPHAEPVTLGGIDVWLTASPEAATSTAMATTTAPVTATSTAPTTSQTAPSDLLQVLGHVKVGALASAKLTGMLDTKRAVLAIDKAEAHTTLDEATLSHLPPAEYEFIKRYQARGTLDASGHGQIALADFSNSQFQARATLSSASMQINDVLVPVKQAQAQFAYPGGRLQLAISDLKLVHAKAAFLSVEHAAADLASLGTKGPIVLDNVSIQQPTVRLIKTSQGTLAGWNDLLHDDKTDTGGSLLEQLQLRRLQVSNGEFYYSGSESQTPLILQNLQASFSTTPLENSTGFALKGRIDQPTFFSAEFQGRTDSHGLNPTIDSVTAQLEVNANTLNKLPGPMQKSLRERRIEGKLAASFTGSLPLNAPAKARGRLQADLKQARFDYRDAQWSIGSLQAAADLPDGPFTAKASSVALVSGTTRFFQSQQIDCKLAHTPTGREPARIDDLTLESPRLLLLASDHGFVGWSNLSPTSSTTTGTTTQLPAATPLPQFGHFRVRNGWLEYRPGGNTPPMILPGINVEAAPPGKEPGWYGLAVSAGSGTDLKLAMDGRANLQQLRLDVQKSSLAARLADKQYSAFPGALQNFLRNQKLKGTLKADFEGSIPFNNLAALQGRLNADLTNGSFATGQTVWPVEQLRCTAVTANRSVNLQYEAKAAGGTLGGRGNLSLSADHPFNINWQATNLQLDKLIPRPEAQGRYAGLLQSQGQFQARLSDLPGSISGGGSAKVDKGSLVHMPIIQGVLNTLINTPLRLRLGENDHGSVDWTFQSDHLQISELEVVTTLATIRGAGKLFYNDRVDMNLNAQLSTVALNRMRGPLGEVGQILGKINTLGGELVTFRVTGTLSRPVIVPLPLGIGAR